MKKFLKDTSFNLISFVLPQIALHIIILPIIAQKIDSFEYGILLSVIAFVNLSAATLGGTLNNSRLINNGTEKETGINYNFILNRFMLINLIFLSASIFIFWGKIDLFTILFILIYGHLILVTTYASVKFRIFLNFKHILLSNIFSVVGYFIGFALFSYTNRWELVYIFGSLFMFIYVIRFSNLNSESKGYDENIVKIRKQVFYILLSSIIISSVTYADKLLVLPILGPENVSIIYVSTFFAKLAVSFVPPISGVLLSYLSFNKTIQISRIYKFIWIALIMVIIILFPTYLLSSFFTNILYPDLYIGAKILMPYTVASSLILVYGSLLNLVVLKFLSSKHYLMINAVYLAIYIVISILMSVLFGILGYAIGSLFSNIIKVIIILIYITVQNRKDKVKNEKQII